MAATLTFVGLVTNGSTYASSAGSFTDDNTQHCIVADFNITLTGNYGTSSSHGDPLSFAISLPFQNGLYAPSWWHIQELVQAGTAPYGYQYNYCPSSTSATTQPTQNGGVLQIWGTGAASGQGGTELTQGSAYSTFTPSLNNAVLRARFAFVRL